MSRKLVASVLAASCAGMFASAQVMAQEDGFTVGNTTITMGGYIKLDTIVVRTSDGSLIAEQLRDFYINGTTPVGDRPSEESVTMHAKTSRFSFRTATDLGTGTPLTGLLEMDFGPGREMLNGTSTTNRSSVNLRHAFFQYGGWGFGQTWSTALYGPAMTETLDFFGLTEGMPSQRTPQIRYTTGPFTISLERPTTTAQVSGTDTSLASLKDEFTESLFPDLVTRYTFQAGSAQLALTGLLRQLEVDGTVSNTFASATPTLDETEVGYGIGVAGNVPLSDATSLKFMALGGSGVGRYTGLAFTPDVEVADDGSDMEAVNHVGFNVGLAHRLNSKWRTNLGFGREYADVDGEKLSESSWSATANLLYSPVKAFTVGVEVIHGVRELVDGTDGSQTRLQFSARYNIGI